MYQPNKGLDHETLASGDRRSLNNLTEFLSNVGLSKIPPPNSNDTTEENVMPPLHLTTDLLTRRLVHPPEESMNNLTQLQRDSNYFSGEMNNRNENNRTTPDGTWFGDIRDGSNVKGILTEVSMD